MSNYKNDAAFARGFDALSGLLNMFLQNKIQQDNVQDERDYQDKNYEKRLQDTIATNMYNNAVKGNGDLYRPIPKQTVAGHEFDSVANNPTGNVDTNDFQKLRNGELSYKMRPNMDSNLGNNYRVKLDNNSARLLNRVYRTNYNVGDVVPYSLFSGVSAMSNTQDRISNNGNITPKEAAKQIMSGFNKYMTDNKLNYMGDDTKVQQAFNDYLQNNSMARYYANFLDNSGAKMLFNELKNNSQQGNNDLRTQAINELKNQGYKITEDNIQKVISLLQKQQ